MDINLLAENLATTTAQKTASKPAAKTVRKISKIEKKPPAFIKRKRVAAYCRVSKDTGDMRHSLSAQVSHYNSYIQSNPEWAFAGIFADLGITGTSTDRRREFNRLIQECDEGNVDIVLCKSVSRFARNTVDTLETVRHLRSIGVEVRFERENLSSLGAEGELLLTLLATFAAEESASISKNVKWEVQKKYEDGKPHSRHRMLGYRWEGDEMLTVPEEAEVVRTIYSEYIGGKSMKKIAAELKAQGVVGINGTPIPEISIKAILKNREYTGALVLNALYNYAPNKTRVNRGEVDMRIVENHHEGIITEEQYAEVERIRKARRGKLFDNPRSCFTGKVVCGLCGHSVISKSYRSGKDKHKIWTMGCSYRDRKQPCDLPWFAEKKMRSATAEVFGHEDFDEEFTEQIDMVKMFTDYIEFRFKDGETIRWDKP